MRKFFDLKENFDIDEGFAQHEFFTGEADEKNEEEIDISSLKDLGIGRNEEELKWNDFDLASLKELGIGRNEEELKWNDFDFASLKDLRDEFENLSEKREKGR